MEVLMSPERLRVTISLLARYASQQDRFSPAAKCLRRLLEYAGFAQARNGQLPQIGVEMDAIKFWRTLLDASPNDNIERVCWSALSYYAVIHAASVGRGNPPQELRNLAYEYLADALRKCDAHLDATRQSPQLALPAPSSSPPQKRGSHLKLVV